MKKLLLILLAFSLFLPVHAQPIASGTIDANGEVVLIPLLAEFPSHHPTISIFVDGTYSGTLQFEATVEGATFESLFVLDQSTETRVTSTTGEGLFLAQNDGYQSIRVRASAFSSGSVEITGYRGASGTVWTGGGGGVTEHLEDDPHTTGDSGILPLAVRQDAQVDLAADGDYIPLTINADGELRVTTAASAGVTHDDDAAFTPATDDIVPAGGMFDDTTPDSVDEGDAGVVRMSANRNLYTTLRDSAGNERGANINASNELLVADGDVATNTSTVAGAIAAEDSAHNSGDSGIPALAVRQDSIASFGDTDNDYVPLQVTGSGQLRVAANVSNVSQIGGTSVVLERCRREEPTYVIINQTAGTQLASGTASERIYICSLQLVTATAQNIALVSGTGTTCGTGTSGVLGGATAAAGWNFSASSGIALASATNPYGRSGADADNLCLLQSGAGQVSGSLTYVSQAP